VFVLGESGLLQPVEDAIKGLRVGESAGFSVPFDADDETIDPSVRGKSLEYRVTLKGLKERDLLPLDDEFARTAGDVETFAEFRQGLVDNMHQRRTTEARGEALAQIIARIAEGASIELPAPMVDQAVEDEIRRLRNSLAQQGVSLEAYLRALETTEEAVREEARPAAIERLRNSLLLRTIAEREAIAVDDETVDAAVERMARVAQDSQQPKQAEAFARSPQLRGMLQSELFERQLTDRLIELATEGRGAVVNAWEPPVAESNGEDVSGADTAATEGEPVLAAASESENDGESSSA
jgi:trigger factor